MKDVKESVQRTPTIASPTKEERRQNLREYAYGKARETGDNDADALDRMDRLVTALQLALDDETDDTPTWREHRDRLVAKVEALKAKARELEGIKRGEGHRCGVCNHAYTPTISGCPACSPANKPCPCKKIHAGKCTACGKEHVLALAGGMNFVVDTRREYQGWVFPDLSAQGPANTPRIDHSTGLALPVCPPPHTETARLAFDEPAPPEPDDIIIEAQRVTAKIAKALQRKVVDDAEKLALARFALRAIACGSRSAARDVAMNVLRVVG